MLKICHSFGTFMIVNIFSKWKIISIDILELTSIRITNISNFMNCYLREPRAEIKQSWCYLESKKVSLGVQPRNYENRALLANNPIWKVNRTAQRYSRGYVIIPFPIGNKGRKGNEKIARYFIRSGNIWNNTYTSTDIFFPFLSFIFYTLVSSIRKSCLKQIQCLHENLWLQSIYFVLIQKYEFSVLY